MGRAQKVRGRAMRELALAILGRHAEKQIQNALACSEAQAHRIIQHDKCPEHLLPRLVEYLEHMLVFAQGRLGAAEHDLRSIRVERAIGRAASRRMATDRARAQKAHRPAAQTELSLLGDDK